LIASKYRISAGPGAFGTPAPAPEVAAARCTLYLLLSLCGPQIQGSPLVLKLRGTDLFLSDLLQELLIDGFLPGPIEKSQDVSGWFDLRCVRLRALASAPGRYEPITTASPI